MNNERRKRITEAMTQLEEIGDEIQDLQSEETEAYENMPDSIRSGERGDASQEASQALESALSSVEQAKSELENIS